MSEFDFLEHYGVTGMKWGVRRSLDTAKGKFTKKNVKKAAAIFGSAAGAAALAIGSAYVANHMKDSGRRNVSTIPPSPRADKLSKAMSQEPVGIVHAARGKHKGWTFPQSGGLSDPVSEYGKAGFDSMPSGPGIRRYGDRNEKVAARYNDPEGRRDRSSRPIIHEVMLPESMARGVKTVEDARDASWPSIKDTYASLYGDD